MNPPDGVTAPRYAVYFSPAADSPWADFGASWLGANTERNATPSGVSAHDWQLMTAEPRRYGFHATLKAPFRLAQVASVGLLRQQLRQLADELHALPLGTLLPRRFNGFVALAPQVQTPALTDLAHRCVADLDPLRAAPRPDETARRHPERLDARERELLALYGYPHVMERFCFHMTLAMCADAAAAACIADHAAPTTARLNQEAPLLLDRLCLFEEPGPGMPFQRLQDFMLRR